jgi:hypothetical protein
LVGNRPAASERWFASERCCLCEYLSAPMRTGAFSYTSTACFQDESGKPAKSAFSLSVQGEAKQ